MAILRRFNMASNEDLQRDIEQIKIFNPSPYNTLVSFRFKRKPYYILFDDSAEDDTEYVAKQIQIVKSGVEGQLMLNPNDDITTYALPFKGKDVYLFTGVNLKKRLDVRLGEEYPDKSRSTWQKHIKAGHVSVNGARINQPSHEVFDTDAVSLSIPEEADNADQTLPIIYLDENVIVVDKPTGALTHSKGELSDEFTVADFFKRYSDYKSGSNRPGIIHRLDRDTSGVIIGARHEEAAKILQKQFADRKAKKTYLAVLSRIPNPEAAIIDLPIGRNPSAPSTFRVDPNGKSAKTIFRTIAANDGGEALVRLNPETGRTHQLRVHMAHIGSPILGDRVYGKENGRLMLHASELEITLPGGERKTFSSKTPEEFKEMFPGIDS